MISVEEADQIIHDLIKPLQPISVELKEAQGCILAQDVKADRNYPPFDKSLMDGIALNFLDYEKGARSFRSLGIQAAGDAQKKLNQKNACFEIMTGSMMPLGCDCVVPVESVINENGLFRLRDDVQLNVGQFITKEGTDANKEDIVLNVGDLLTAPRIALCACVGQSKVFVQPKWKVAVVSTGNELVAADQPVLQHQIRSSNDYFIKALLESTQLASCESFHLKDDEEFLFRKIQELINRFDCIVLSGGVSMGKFDLIPKVLHRLNVRECFHKVAQKPGKPMWFGVSEDLKPVFALPGNPVSSYTCSVRFVRRHLLKVKKCIVAVSEDSMESSLDITEYKMVQMSFTEAGAFFKLSPFKGSGDLISIAQADGFVEISPEHKSIKKGDLHTVYLW